MNAPIPIHKLSLQIGVTSRTLRHWESEGLFRCMRDRDSGWRVYDENAVFCICTTALLRQLDVPIREIKTVLDRKTYVCLRDVVNKQILVLRASNEENVDKEKRLRQFLSVLEGQDGHVMADSWLQKILVEMEECAVSNTQSNDGSMKFITLPPMRTVYNVAVSISPEDEAMNPVLEWLESAGLTGTARLFGGNMPPMPSGAGKPYGYGMCASIPQGISVPEHLKEMHLSGGIYARFESPDDIPASWRKLMKLLSEDEQYISDRSRLCFEEHIRNDSGGFLNILLEPVKTK